MTYFYKYIQIEEYNGYFIAYYRDYYNNFEICRTTTKEETLKRARYIIDDLNGKIPR